MASIKMNIDKKKCGFLISIFFLFQSLFVFAQPVNPYVDSLIHLITVDSYQSHFDSLKTSEWCYRKVTSTYVQSEDHDLCRDYLYHRFKEYLGEDNCYLHSFDVLLYRGLANVIGFKPGKCPWKGIIVVGAHYDSNNNLDKILNMNCAPGANDNGTGLAALLEIMRILKDMETGMPVVFAAWDLEEQYHYGYASGSNAWFQQFIIRNRNRPTNWLSIGREGKINISDLAMNVNFDMFGHPLDSVNGKPLLWVCNGNPGHMVFTNRYVETLRRYLPEIAVINYGQMIYSDHYTFANRGIPSVENLESEYISNPFYHTCSDHIENPDNISYEFATHVARGGLAFILEQAGIFETFRHECTKPGDVFMLSEHPGFYVIKMKPGFELLNVYSTNGNKVPWEKRNGYFSIFPNKSGLLFFEVKTGSHITFVSLLVHN
ncbi:MAG: M28 family peptidase [Prolixibacteraceae bacterium]|nr:M28 family peptidase [Prolixibacteraceae bacterium]